LSLEDAGAVGGIVAVGKKTMSAKQLPAIEEHIGIAPKELEEADLAAAMQDLGIPDEEISGGAVEA